MHIELVEFLGEHDHMHLLVNYPPKVAVSALVNRLKDASSQIIRQKNHPAIHKNCGAVLFDCHRILLEPLGVLQSASLAIHKSVGEANLRAEKKLYELCTIFHCPEQRGLSRT